MVTYAGKGKPSFKDNAKTFTLPKSAPPSFLETINACLGPKVTGYFAKNKF